jgi:type I restriction enzyme, S subunit
MELKLGYKQTEVGVIPEDWEIRKCSDLSERIMVGVVIRPSQYYTRDGVPALRSANIREDGINDIDLVFISEESNQLLAKSQVREGDVLTVRTGYPGTSAVAESKHSGSNCIDILITRPSDQVDPRWLCLWINSPFGKEQVLRNQGGLAQKHFNVGDMRNLVVALPKIAEQRAISTAIRDVDVLIRSIEELIDKKRDIKQAAMQELLSGKRRLPGFEGEWETVAISQIAEKITGFWGRTEPGNEAIHSTNVIRAGDISEDGRLVGTACRYLSHHEISVAGCRSGDTVMTASGNGLGKSWTCGQDGVYSASNFVRIIRPLRGKADGHFIGYALKSRGSRSKLIEHTATSAYPNLKTSFFNDSWLPLPPEAEQKAISRVLQDIDIEILELEARKLKASQLKQGMMQQLLTGKIRLT